MLCGERLYREHTKIFGGLLGKLKPVLVLENVIMSWSSDIIHFQSKWSRFSLVMIWDTEHIKQAKKYFYIRCLVCL